MTDKRSDNGTDHSVTTPSRRRATKLIGAAAVAPALATPLLWTRRASAQTLEIKPEKGARLRVLRWKRFVQADEDLWLENTRKFSEKTGIEVRTDHEAWEDLRPKAAVAANVGAGPDVIVGWLDDPQQYPDKLVDLTDLAEYLDKKYGGWFPAARAYGTVKGRWIGLPLGASGALINYRKSWRKEAGFDSSLTYSMALMVSGLLIATLLFSSTRRPPKPQSMLCIQVSESPVAWDRAKPGGWPALFRAWHSLR